MSEKTTEIESDKDNSEEGSGEYEAPALDGSVSLPSGLNGGDMGGLLARLLAGPLDGLDLEGKGMPLGLYRDLASLVVFHSLMSKAPKARNDKEREALLNGIMEATGTLTAHLVANKQMAETIDMTGGGDDD